MLHRFRRKHGPDDMMSKIYSICSRADWQFASTMPQTLQTKRIPIHIQSLVETNGMHQAQATYRYLLSGSTLDTRAELKA